MILVHFKGKSFNITVIQLCAPTTDVKEAEVDSRKTYNTFYWKAKFVSQEIPVITGKFDLGVQNETGQKLTILSREHTGHSKNAFPTIQVATLHMDITGWSIPKSD